MSFAVSGLSSGLDTTALVDGLMFAERATVRRLQASRANESAALDAWTNIETLLSELRTASASLRTGGALRAATASSSDETIMRATAVGEAAPGSYSFTVDTLASTQQVASAGLASGGALTGAGSALVTAGFGSLGASLTSNNLTGGTYTLNVLSIDQAGRQAVVVFDGIEQTVSLESSGRQGDSLEVMAGDGGTARITAPRQQQLQVGSASLTVIDTDATTTVNSLSAALNQPGGPVRAQVIETGDGSSTSYRLVLTSRETGVAHAADIDLSGLAAFSGGLTTLRGASDAVISLGDGGLAITRPTNTIGDLFDGISVDLVGTSEGAEVEILVSADLESRVGAVRSVVESVSSILERLSAYTGYDVDRQAGGPLVGSFSARSVSSEISKAMGTVVSSSSFSLLSQLGVSIELDGTYALDEDKLQQALADDPAGVERVLLGDLATPDDGVLDIVDATIERLVGTAGRIQTAKLGAEQTIEELDRSISSQEVRLGNVEERYMRQFAALEALLGQLNTQSNFLSSFGGQASGGA